MSARRPEAICLDLMEDGVTDRGATGTQRAYARLAGFMILFVLASSILGLIATSSAGAGLGFVERSVRGIRARLGLLEQSDERPAGPTAPGSNPSPVPGEAGSLTRLDPAIMVEFGSPRDVSRGVNDGLDEAAA